MIVLSVWKSEQTEKEGRDKDTIGGEQEMRRVLALAPLDPIDLLLDLERLEVIELWLVRLKLGMKLILASFFLRLISLFIPQRIQRKPTRERGTKKGHKTNSIITLEQNNAPAFIARGKEIAGMIEFNGGYDVRYPSSAKVDETRKGEEMTDPR